jgi:tRNA splicing ligase
VTSKHFIPSDKTDVTAHAGVGYNWLLEHLKTVNKTEKDMAEWLNEKNITLVAELCDDDFQQHILPYVDKARGLYLHGINYNTTTLYTLPSDTVDQVAASFGFHTIAFDTFETAKDVKAFGEKMQATGLYNGREIEGAVVRCKRLGMDFMFKIKNEQYLVYREYREVTKRLIDVKDGVVVINKEKEKTVKCTYEKTRYYIDWMRNQIDEHPDWFIEFKNEKGIIQVREAFEDYWKNGQLGNIGPITKAKK